MTSRRRPLSSVCVVFVTCPTQAVARRVARAVLESRLAACVNVLPGIRSWFRWQGKLEQAREVLLVIKTARARMEPLRRKICSLHPYDVPEIIALPVVQGHRPYLAWVLENASS